MNQENQLESQIEAILFFKGEAVSLKKLADILDVSIEEVQQSILNLKESYTLRGISIVEKDDEVMLTTSPVYGEMIENLRKEELNKELSKASLEVLSIILYKNGASRAEIDYIRGVNSSFSLRALSVRGLVERTIDDKDSRKYVYKPTFELLNYMGVSNITDLPEYNSLVEALDENLKTEEEEKEEQTND